MSITLFDLYKCGFGIPRSNMNVDFGPNSEMFPSGTSPIHCGYEDSIGVEPKH